MGIFRNKFMKRGSSVAESEEMSMSSNSKLSCPSNDSKGANTTEACSSSNSSARSTPLEHQPGSNATTTIKSNVIMPPAAQPKLQSLTSIPIYVNDLATAKSTTGERALRALRKLFALSEHASFSENRVEMVHNIADAQLVPVLLEFLGRCGKGSSEQYLALLVLNNISIPPENKRFIALECGGAAFLSRLLCEDPSCHLIAIVLVNLTFADAELRSALLSYDSDIEIIEALSFVLRVASLTQAEYEHRQLLVEHNSEDPKTPRELLRSLLAEDHNQYQQQSRGSSGGSTSSAESDKKGETNSHDSSRSYHSTIPKPTLLPPWSQQLFPDTARWALSAIKNLTRPSKDPMAAHTLIEIGIVPHIMRFLVVGGKAILRTESLSSSDDSVHGAGDSCNSGGDETPVPSEPEQHLLPSEVEAESATSSNGQRSTNADIRYEDCVNSPTTWSSNSAQDAALFVVLNLCAVPSIREYIREADAIQLLSRITLSERHNLKLEHHPFEEDELLEFQRLKARMALSYIIGSEGHFGQPRFFRRSSSTLGAFSPRPTNMFTSAAKDNNLLLVVTAPEVTRLVELLATTLHCRTKEGAGGYSAATFSVKCVLLALRCLLTNYENQVRFANAQGTQLNSLLVKVLALHSLNDGSLYVDAEAAEHAAFSLYLVSNYCFKDIAFLPAFFGGEKVTETIAAKILVAYRNRADITAPAKHAVDQLMLRLKYLLFDGTEAELAVRSGSSTTGSDFVLEDDLLQSLRSTYVNPQKPGARPDDNIFDRPLFRRRALRDRSGSQKTPRDNQQTSPVDSFPNALQAVQELSFASVKVRHIDAIDDILIANNIVHSANGEKTESYNSIWTWQDSDHLRIEPQRSAESFLPFGSPVGKNGHERGLPGAFSILDSLCGMPPA